MTCDAAILVGVIGDLVTVLCVECRVRHSRFHLIVGLYGAIDIHYDNTCTLENLRYCFSRLTASQRKSPRLWDSKC